MDALFPLGFPLATALYLSLYILTLVVHVIFMNYVLAGAAYLAVRGLKRSRDPSAISETLRDWLPAALSAAITAGVAPLLFIQILYQRPFYTANLLLHHRWMSILPILILGFYLLYVLKSSPLVRRPRLRAVIGVVVFLCFAWTAFSWTGNHLLSLQPTSEHARFYADRQLFHAEAVIVPRLLMWCLGAIPTMCLLVAWQHFRTSGAAATVNEKPVRRLAIMSLLGLFGAAGCAALYASLLGNRARAFTTEDATVLGGVLSMRSLTLPWLVLAVVGFLAHLAAWVFILMRRRFQVSTLVLASCGCLLNIVGVTVVREALRIQQLGSAAMVALQEQHATALEVSGTTLFVVFLVLNAGLVTWCLRIVSRAAPAAR